MSKAFTLPDIQRAILHRLQSLRNQTEELPPLNCTWPGLNEIVSAQDMIGWRNFMEGGILQAWAAKQQEYYNWIQKRNTGKRWITTLIKKLWEISWNMWEQRNGELTNPASPASLREHARLDALISHEYTDIATLTQRDRRWFRCPLLHSRISLLMLIPNSENEVQGVFDPLHGNIELEQRILCTSSICLHHV
jgi:hypothetical protein